MNVTLDPRTLAKGDQWLLGQKGGRLTADLCQHPHWNVPPAEGLSAFSVVCPKTTISIPKPMPPLWIFAFLFTGGNKYRTWSLSLSTIDI